MDDHTTTDAPVTLAILGASGDLTHRLLLPGLGTLLRARKGLQVDMVGVANDGLDEQSWRDRVAASLADGGCGSERARELAASTRYEEVDVTDAAQFGALLGRLGAPG